MKRIASILLIAMLIFNFLGGFILFKMMQHEIRQDIKKSIKKNIAFNDLELITITPSNAHLIQWVHQKEFYYKGKLYDIIKKVNSDNDTIHYYCINDKKEEQLIKNYAAFSKSQYDDNPSKNKYNSLYKLLIKDYFSKESSITNYKNLHTTVYGEIKDCFFLIYLEKTFPPPKNT